MKGLKRIISIVGSANIVESLSSSNLSWADLNSLLLKVFEEKTRGITPSVLMSNYKENRFSAVSGIDPRRLLRIDGLLYEVLPNYFLPVELSPVSPIGINSTLTNLDSKIVLSTIRNVEVIGDSSIALSMECANRRRLTRKTKESGAVNLATSHRVLRLQNFTKDSGYSAHFRAFALASAGRDTAGYNTFELNSLSTHISTWLNFLDRSSEIGFFAKNISVAISDLRIVEKIISKNLISRDEVILKMKDKEFNLFKTCSIDLPNQTDSMQDIPVRQMFVETHIRELQFTEKQMIDSLRVKYPLVNFYFDLSRSAGIGYYSGLCYKLTAENKSGRRYSLAGGGACDWTKKLLSSEKEHIVSSGFGTEMLYNLFTDIS